MKNYLKIVAMTLLTVQLASAVVDMPRESTPVIADQSSNPIKMKTTIDYDSGLVRHDAHPDYAKEHATALEEAQISDTRLKELRADRVKKTKEINDLKDEASAPLKKLEDEIKELKVTVDKDKESLNALRADDPKHEQALLDYLKNQVTLNKKITDFKYQDANNLKLQSQKQDVLVEIQAQIVKEQSNLRAKKQAYDNAKTRLDQAEEAARIATENSNLHKDTGIIIQGRQLSPQHLQAQHEGLGFWEKFKANIATSFKAFTSWMSGAHEFAETGNNSTAFTKLSTQEQLESLNTYTKTSQEKMRAKIENDQKLFEDQWRKTIDDQKYVSQEIENNNKTTLENIQKHELKLTTMTDEKARKNLQALIAMEKQKLNEAAENKKEYEKSNTEKELSNFMQRIQGDTELRLQEINRLIKISRLSPVDSDGNCAVYDAISKEWIKVKKSDRETLVAKSIQIATEELKSEMIEHITTFTRSITDKYTKLHEEKKIDVATYAQLRNLIEEKETSLLESITRTINDSLLVKSNITLATELTDIPTGVPTGQPYSLGSTSTMYPSGGEYMASISAPLKAPASEDDTN